MQLCYQLIGDESLNTEFTVPTVEQIIYLIINYDYMSFDYCVFHINSAHIYIDPKGRCPCKERHKHVFLSMNRSKYVIQL